MAIGVRSALKRKCGVASCRDHRIAVAQPELCRNRRGHGIRTDWGSGIDGVIRSVEALAADRDRNAD